jgi:thioredoxin 2
MSSDKKGGPRATVACPACQRLNRVDLGRADDRPRCGHCRAAIPVDRPLPASDGSLERILRDAEVPVLVDFYADWCGPCKSMAPILDAVATDRSGRALVVKVDTDRNPGSAARYGIRGIPTLILFRSGAEVQRQVGAVARGAIEAMVDRG